MFDLKIEQLRLNIKNAAGHEHRIPPIALRAVTLLASHLDGPSGSGLTALSGRQLNALNAEPIDLELSNVSDEQAAEGIARTWANALAAKPNEQN
jgi:hypothetical protein